jgi:uncharacterized membrane protein
VLQGLPLLFVFGAMLLVVDVSALSARFWWLMAATGLAHAVYLYGLSLAFAGGDLSLVYPIARSTPAFLPLVAVPLAGERLSWAGGVGIATVVAGMWAVQLGGDGSPPDDVTRRGALVRRLTSRPVGFAYLALAASVAYGVIDKLLVTELAGGPPTGALPPSLVAFFALWAGCVVFFVPMALLRLPHGVLKRTLRKEWRTVTLASGIGIAGYSLILKALETAPASYVVAVRQSSVLFVLVLSVGILGERPTAMRVAGALATVTGVALIAIAG